MKKISNIFWIILSFLLIGYFFLRVAKRTCTDLMLKHNAQFAKAVIINDKNYNGNGGIPTSYSYSYQFEINGEKYTGNSNEYSLNIGDTIEIEYVKSFPILNKPLHSKH